ncbi:MAG: Mth938-like domain-containing protein [Desulfobacteraceae bacterium]
MISHYSFGSIVVNGTEYKNDIRITGKGEVVPEWWRRSGHTVEVEDLSLILDDDTETVVLGKGKPGMMKASHELKKYLDQKGIELIEQKTEKAVDTVNRLFRENRKFAAGFHLTC